MDLADLMRHLVIRDMKKSDIPSVVEIENISFSTPWSSHSFMKEIYKPNSISRVATIDYKVVGYICAERIIDEAHILNIAVHPDYRKMGIGSLLVSTILEELRNTVCRYIYLEVRASNHAAVRLYKRFNFKIVGIRKDYYTLPKEDAYIMMLELNNKTFTVHFLTILQLFHFLTWLVIELVKEKQDSIGFVARISSQGNSM